MRNKIYIGLLVGLLILGIGIFRKNQKATSHLERKYLARVVNLEGTKLEDGTFQKKLEDVLIDQFYNKEDIIKLFYKTKLALYSPFSEGLIKLADDVIQYDGYYIKDIIRYEESLIETTKNRAYNIQEIANIYSDIPFYIYKPTRIEETNLLDTDSIHSYGLEYENEFKGQLHSVQYKAMKLSSFEDYKSMYYKTDIHWNIDGVYRGYKDIIEMLNKDFEIGKPKAKSEKFCYPEVFYGSVANRLGQQTVADAICDFKIEGIKDYTYSVNGTIVPDNSKKEYAENKHDRIYSDYDNYYGGNDYERVYDFGDNTGVNVLMLVDSFINPSKEWLASHFDKTVLLDLRSLPNRDEFSLGDYLEKYDIDAVVVTMYYDNLYFNSYNFIPVR